MKQGQKYIYRFEFDGRLWPGIYFVGAGISEIKSKDEFIHRVVDLSLCGLEKQRNCTDWRNIIRNTCRKKDSTNRRIKEMNKNINLGNKNTN